MLGYFDGFRPRQVWLVALVCNCDSEFKDQEYSACTFGRKAEQPRFDIGATLQPTDKPRLSEQKISPKIVALLSGKYCGLFH
jgi:hypothetical protein